MKHVEEVGKEVRMLRRFELINAEVVIGKLDNATTIVINVKVVGYAAYIDNRGKASFSLFENLVAGITFCGRSYQR